MNKLVLLLLLGLSLLTSVTQAARPTWTLTPVPGSQTTQTLPAGSTSVIQYVVQNQSARPHELSILPMAGVQQTAPCLLAPRGFPNSSCLLNLSITSDKLPRAGIHEGPFLCQTDKGAANPNQCYRPSPANSLNLTPATNTNQPVTYGYISSIFGQNLTKCLISASGDLGNCTPSSINFIGTLGVLINKLGNTIYVTNRNNNESLSNITQCTIDANDDLSACIATSLPDTPVGMTLNKAETKIYIAAGRDEGVYICQVNTSHRVTECVEQGDANSPSDVALNPAETILYVAGTEVTRCNLNASGYISSCVPLSTPQASGIALNSAGSLAYLASTDDGAVFKCGIDSGGNFSTCETTGTGFTAPTDIVLDAQKSLAYVTDFNGQISQCQIASNGDLTACTAQASVTQPFSIAIH